MKKRRARSFVPTLLRALRFFVVDFHRFSDTSPVAAPQVTSGVGKRLEVFYFDD
jgi:hypothetical protein